MYLLIVSLKQPQHAYPHLTKQSSLVNDFPKVPQPGSVTVEIQSLHPNSRAHTVHCVVMTVGHGIIQACCQILQNPKLNYENKRETSFPALQYYKLFIQPVVQCAFMSPPVILLPVYLQDQAQMPPSLWSLPRVHSRLTGEELPSLCSQSKCHMPLS